MGMVKALDNVDRSFCPEASTEAECRYRVEFAVDTSLAMSSHCAYLFQRDPRSALHCLVMSLIMASSLDLQRWLREQCAEFIFRPEGVYVANGEHGWPLVADTADDLTSQLDAGGHLVSLPKESAALANVIEVALVDFLLERLEALVDADGQRGQERSYPDLEISGDAFSGGFHAIDVKMARLNKNGKQTQSRCTLYTGNTYFKFPSIRWPGMYRSFDSYQSHLDIIGIYRLDVDYRGRVRDLELHVHEPWRIASRDRSSTTREYIGAVVDLDALRAGDGEFEDEKAFYDYWRSFPFRTTRAVEQQLQKALRQQVIDPSP